MWFRPKNCSGVGLCFAQLGQAWAKGRQEPGFGFSGAAGESQTPRWVSWQRWLREIGSTPGEATGDGRLGWPERRRALIAATVSAEGLWETHVLPDLSADYFLQNKRHYFRTGNLHFSALPPPLSLSLSHTHTFLLPWGILAAAAAAGL